MRKISIVLSILLSFTMLSSRVSALTTTFNDVPEDAWYASYVEALVDEGIVDPSTSFRPEASLNRQNW